MRVRFKVNLGSNDALPLKLDYQQCRKGMELDVPEAAAKWLVAKGHAVEVVEIKAVAPKPAMAQATAAVFPQSKPAPLASMVKPKDKFPSNKER